MSHKSGETPSYRVTSAGVNPAEDRAHRMRMYFIAMTLRLACVLSLFWVSGWWIVIPVVGAIGLPWFAVMVGNAVAHGGEQEVAAPDPLELTTTEPAAGAGPADEGPQLLVVDVDPVRRSQRAPEPSQRDPEPSQRDPEPAAQPAETTPDAEAPTHTMTRGDDEL